MYNQLNDFIKTFQNDPDFTDDEKAKLISQIKDPLYWISAKKAERFKNSAEVTEEMKAQARSKVANNNLSSKAKERIYNYELQKLAIEKGKLS